MRYFGARPGTQNYSLIARGKSRSIIHGKCLDVLEGAIITIMCVYDCYRYQRRWMMQILMPLTQEK